MNVKVGRERMYRPNIGPDSLHEVSNGSGTIVKVCEVQVSKINEVIKTIWETNTIPEEWKSAIICPIFKKGNPTKTEKYRGISLLDTGCNILILLIFERINPYIEKIVGSCQCRFRRGKSTTDHIFAQKQIMAKYYEFGKDLHLIFVDYLQACDSVDREELWKVLKFWEYPKNMLT